MADKDALFDELSKEFPAGKYTTFCNQMGFSYNEAQNMLTRFKENSNVALRDLLSQWDLKMKGVTRKQLEDALDGAEVGGLCSIVDKHYSNASRRVVAAAGLVAGDGAVHDTRNEFINQSDRSDSVNTNQEDIYSKKISESLTVLQCREKLENKYRNQLCKIQMKPWDQSDYAEFEDMHTVVTMVQKDAHGKDTNTKEILQGSVADIFSTKVNGRLPARILISAPAGRGKTTAVAKMAYDWVHREGSALEHLPLLFVVKFRNTSQLTSIGEAIKSQLLSDVDDLTPEGLESFIRKNQGICHIILDGLDEYAGISSSNRSLGSNIVSVIRWEEFPECRVLVTTRPHLEYFFNQAELPRVYTKMWIEGFSQESSREYIDKFFASTSNPYPGHRHGLKVYLDGQPLINELVKTPLFCLMVCHLWSEGLLDRCTTTQTELLDSVNVFLTHHANIRAKSRVTITTDELRKIIYQVGQVALTGLLDDAKKLVFTPHDFRRVPAILDKACELGIVSKTNALITGLPQPNETTSTTIEFYHKLAQEHSAGKYLAAKTKKYMLRLKISKLDTLLQKIKANIGDYENLIRFAAGTDNRLCIRIMEALLSNRFLDESERYRILLDCSSEIKSTGGNVSSLVQRCVTAQSIVLKSPTVYTVVGMLNLPMEVKNKVRTVKFEGSTLTTDVTSGLWSCLKDFSMLDTLVISDSSLSFPPSPPELLSVTKLSAERVTSQCYEGVLSSIPGVRDIDVSIDVAETSNTFQITTASRLMNKTSTSRAMDEQFFVHIRLHALTALTTDRKIESGETIGGLSLFFEDQIKNQQRLHVSGVRGRDEEALVDLFVKTKQLTYLNSGSGGGTLHKKNNVQNTRLEIEQCQLSTEMTTELWSCLRSFTSLNPLIISDSSLSFPPSPPELPSITKLSAVSVTSHSYEGLLSSLPGLRVIDITIDDAERDISQITAGLGRTGGQQLTDIELASSSLPSEKKSVSRETMKGLGLLIREQTKNLQRLNLSGMKCLDEEDLVELVESSTYLKALDSLHLQFLDGGCFEYDGKSGVQDDCGLLVKNCQLSTVMTARMWSCLRSFTSLNHLTISDSSLSFPPSPPELPSVTNLSAERVTSQSYEGLLSSLPGLREIDITIGDARTEDISQIQTSLRRHLAGQDLTRIDLSSLQSEENVSSMSRMRMEGLGLLITGWHAMLSGILFGPENAVIDLVQSSMRLMSASLFIEQFSGSLNSDNHALNINMLNIKDCQLSTEMTEKFWSCLRSFTSLNHLTISDSSLSFPPSPPELPSVTNLSAESVTSQSYEGLLSSLPGLRRIGIIIDDAERDIAQITAGLRRTGGQQLTDINLTAPDSLPSEKKSVSRETMRGLGLLIREQTKNLQLLNLSGMKCLDEEDLVELVESSTYSKALYSLHLQSLEGGCFEYDGKSGDQNECRLLVKKCQLSTEMTARMWSCLRSFTSLNHLNISDSSLSFPSSPPELPSVTKLSAESVTSQSYEGLLSSLPGLRDIDITIDDAERDIAQITAGLGRTGGQQLTHIDLRAPDSLPSEKKSVSRETMRGLGLLIREQTKNLQRLNLSGIKCLDEEDLVELVESSTYSKALDSLCLQSLEGGCFEYDRKSGVQHKCRLLVKKCQLSTEMTARMWSCLRSFTSLHYLIISDSSLSFPPSPPELPSVTELSTWRVTSQSYECLLSSLPGLREIGITIDDAERDIAQITACLRRTGGQQLTHIYLAPSSIPSEKMSVSRETMRGLGLLIREQTKNLQWLNLIYVKCTDEEDLVYLIECCRHVKTMSKLGLLGCKSEEGGRLESHLEGLQASSTGNLTVWLYNRGRDQKYSITHTD